MQGDASLPVDEIIGIQLITDLVSLDLSFRVALPKLENDITDLALILLFIIVYLLKQQQVDHHALSTARQQDILPI